MKDTRSFESVNVGDTLPELAIELTPTVIISTAIASRDYQDVHHDVELAQSRGTKNIFMNILSTNGFVGRYVTDWAGPNSMLRRVKIRLGVPNYPGDTMTFSGTVKEKTEEGDQGIVAIDVVGANGIGNHVTGTVDVALPKGS